MGEWRITVNITLFNMRGCNARNIEINMGVDFGSFVRFVFSRAVLVFFMST
jgi:hypothetical protein